MARSLAEGKKKIALLTTKPADPFNPKLSELTAGTDISCAVLESDFTWMATDSDKVQEKAVCTTNNAQAISASNYTTAMTVFRYFDGSTKNADAVADAAFAALKLKGTTVWIYVRETAKNSTDAWAVGDELYLGGEVLTDTPQRQQGGFIKDKIPMEMQTAYEQVKVVTG